MRYHWLGEYPSIDGQSFQQNMSTQDLQTYIDHCAQTTRDYKHLHRQHLTVFAAFQKLQRASKDLVRCTRSIQSQLGIHNKDELKHMLEEQERIAQDIHLMNSDSYHPNIHDDSELIKVVLAYLENTSEPPLEFRSFYGTHSLENIDVASLHRTHPKPFKHMLSQLVTKLKWYDYIFHYLIPGMFEFDELKQLSSLKSNPYYPCLVITCKQDNDLFSTFVQKVNEQKHNPNLRVQIQSPVCLNHYEYYCPVIDNEQVLLHHAHSIDGASYLSQSNMDQLESELSMSLTFFENGIVKNTFNLNVEPKSIQTLHNCGEYIENTFKEHAFSLHPSSVYDEKQYTYTNMAKTCVTEYQKMINVVNTIWNLGYTRLHNAINDSENVQNFINEQSPF